MLMWVGVGRWNGRQWLEYDMKEGRTQVKPKNPAFKGCAGSLMAEMKQNQH